MTTNAQPQQCFCCGKQAVRTCSACREAKYCDMECQKQDWPSHKMLCKKLADFQARPTTGSRRVVFFPPYGTEPQFSWLPVEDSFDDTETVDYTSLSDGKILTGHSIICNELNGAPIDGVVEILYYDHWIGEYPINEAVVASTSGKHGDEWGGPMVAIYGKASPEEEMEEDIGEVQDFDMKAYNCLVAHFTARNRWWWAAMPPPGEESVQAVLVQRNDERPKDGSSFCTATLIPKSHRIFQSSTKISAISKRIGMPLLTFKLPITYHPGKASNEEVTFMQCSIKADSEKFGFAPLDWTGGRVGDVLIARVDKRPLDPIFVEAFGSFCLHHLLQYYQLRDELHDGEVSEARLEEITTLAVEQATPEIWAQHQADWRKLNKAGIVDDPKMNGRVDGAVRMGLTKEDGDKLCDHLPSRYHQVQA